MVAIDAQSPVFSNETSFRRSILAVSLAAIAMAFIVIVTIAAIYNHDKGIRQLKQNAEVSLNIVSIQPLAQIVEAHYSIAAEARLQALTSAPNFRAGLIADTDGNVIAMFPNPPGALDAKQLKRGLDHTDTGHAADLKIVSDNIVIVRKPLYTSPPDRHLVGFIAAQYSLANTKATAWRELSGSIIGAFLILGLVGVILHVSLGRVTSPLEKLAQAVLKIADGDLTSEVPSQTRSDQIGMLARAIQFFKEKLVEREALQTEKASTQSHTDARRRRLDALIDEFRFAVADTLEQVSVQGDAMTLAATNLAGIATESNHQAHEAARAITESSSNVRTVARASEELSSSINEIERQVTKTRRVVTTAARTTIQTRSATDALAVKAEEIGEIIALIQAIAEQTNMLALNATIEAVRAGESGRGFAVVAQEVKSLASQTTRASQHIADHALAIEAVTGKVIEAIGAIAETMTEAQDATEIIAVAVQQQSSAATEISRSVAETAAGTESVAGNVNHVAICAAETDASANKVHHAADNVATQAKRLSETVDGFLRNVAAI